ncbi:MAG: SDR family NAD(P)-dependent oxidoreductase [Rickettsiales bacterium]|nr:SDR family NAD(P)-dependent oxidoreductase [Rickettsiales bacterium]
MKTALVTGGNKGIGFEACRQLAHAGFRVFLAARNAQAGEAAAASLGVDFLPMDVTDEASITAAAKALASRIPALNVLVNNAGIFIKEDGMDFTSADILQTFQTNTLGPLLAARAFLPLLEAAKGAHIINVSSGMGQLHDMREGSVAYRISKTALNAVTCILAAEFSDRRILVNSICPGWVKTNMGGPGATRTPAQGADTITWLAQGGEGKTARFYRDRAEISW